MDTKDKNIRYQRQIILNELGLYGQHKLLSSKVLVIGAGGLGCPALQYLSAAGVGQIGIVDFDVVEISNLHRQVLYSMSDIGKPKAEAAARKIIAFNPEIQTDAFIVQLTNKNALEFIRNYDLVIDCSDNFYTRYLVNDACVILEKPLIYGAVMRFEGQVGVFNMVGKDAKSKANYRDLFPAPPDFLSAFSCKEVGVLGVVPGIIGTMQAAEAIKIISGVGTPLCNKIISYNILNNSFFEFSVLAKAKETGTFPRNESQFLSFDYNILCSQPADPGEISIDEFNKIRSTENITIINVCEKDEQPIWDGFEFIQHPLSNFTTSLQTISLKDKIVLFCRSGKRSLKALKLLKDAFPDCNAYSLKGGMNAFVESEYKTPISHD